MSYDPNPLDKTEPVSGRRAATAATEFRELKGLVQKTLRMPEDSAVNPTLPTIAQRANKLLSFDDAGNPVAIAPAGDSSEQLRLDLASTAEGKGAALVSFKQAGAGAVDRTALEKMREGVVSLADFIGFVGNGTNDDRAAVLAARSEALASGRDLWCPPGYTVRLGASTDLGGVKRLRFESNVVIPSGTLTVGGFFNSGGGRIELADVTNGTSLFATPPATPVLRITGVSESFISLGSCNNLQLYADAGVPDNRAVAYNQIRLTGSISLLDLTDSGAASSYVNENFIYADRVFRLKIRGVGYNHNHNKLFHPCMEGEGTELLFQNASMNQVYGARFEAVGASPGVTFDAGSYSNTVLYTWTGAGTPEDQFRITIPVADAGRGNMVSSEAATQFRKNRLFAVGPNSGILSTASATTAADPRIAPAANGISPIGAPAVIVPSLRGFTPSTFAFIALSDPVAVRQGDVVAWDADYDGDILRPVVYVLDAQMRPLTSPGAGGAFYQQVDAGSLTVDGYYTSSSPLGVQYLKPGVVLRSEVKFIRVGGFLSASGFMRRFSASVYSQPLGRGDTEVDAAQINSIRALNGAPTQGYVQQGTTIFDRAAKVMRWVSYQHESTLTGALSAGATSATIANGTGLANGDLCGILLDNDTTHWTAVAGLSGATFTIAAIPAGRSAAAGARAVFNRWAS